MIHIPDDKLNQLLTAIHHAAKREEPCEYGLPVACDDWMALARVEVRDWLGAVTATAVDNSTPVEPGPTLKDILRHACATSPEGFHRALADARAVWAAEPDPEDGPSGASAGVTEPSR